MKAKPIKQAPWACAQPKKDWAGDMAVNEDLHALTEALEAPGSATPLVVAYMLPNRLKAHFETHSIAHWKKFYKSAAALKQKHPSRLELRAFEGLINKGRGEGEAHFMAGAFELYLLDPDLFALWSELEALAHKDGRKQVDLAFLAGVLKAPATVVPTAPPAPAAPAVELQQLHTAMARLHRLTAQHERLQADYAQLLQKPQPSAAPTEAPTAAPTEAPKAAAQPQHTLVLIQRLHSLQHRHDELQQRFHQLQQQAQLAPVAVPSPAPTPADVLLLSQRLHKLQNDYEKLQIKNKQLEDTPIEGGNASQYELKNWKEGHNEESQRLSEQLAFVQGELARQHAIAHACQIELQQLCKAMQQGNDYLLARLR